jgi:hypothetical protein
MGKSNRRPASPCATSADDRGCESASINACTDDD